MAPVQGSEIRAAFGGSDAQVDGTGTETTATGTAATPTQTAPNASDAPQFFLDLGLLPEWFWGWPWNLTRTVIVLALAYVASGLVVRLLSRRLARRFDRPSLTRTAIRGIRTGIFVFALLIVLGIWGLGLGDIALQVTVLTAVVGVILAPIVGSFISGVFLLADQPYEIGDMIQLDEAGTRGFVEDITLRYTKVFTLDNTFLVIPNGTIRDRDVYNFSAEDPRTRLSIEVLVTYESDVPLARRRIEAAARTVDGVIEGGPSIRIGSSRYPAAPTCLIEEFGDHGVSLSLRFWAREPYRIRRVRSDVQANVWDAIEAADVEFAYPHSHLYFDETSGSLDVDGSSAGSSAGRPRPQVRGDRGPTPARPGRPHADRDAAPESEAESTDDGPEDADK